MVKRNEKGFTLIELMIVVAIIGILAAIAIPQFNAYKQRGYASSVKTDLRNAYTSAQAYYVDSLSGSVAAADLAAYGFSSTNSTVSVVSGTQSALIITAVSVVDSGISGTIDNASVISGTFSH